MNIELNTRHLADYPDVMTPEEVQFYLSIGRNTIYALLKSGELPSIRIGKQYRIPKCYLQRYLDPCYNQERTDD